MVFIVKKLGPMQPQTCRHVAQTIETPIIKNRARAVEQASNLPAYQIAKLVGGDPAGRTEQSDLLRHLVEATPLTGGGDGLRKEGKRRDAQSRGGPENLPQR